MNNKLLVRVGIGAGVLLLAFFALKKFMTNSGETAPPAASEPAKEEKSEKSAKVESPSANAPSVEKRIGEKLKRAREANKEVNFSESDEFFQKYGITESDYNKMRSFKQKLDNKLGNEVSDAKKMKRLKAFASKNNISFSAFMNVKKVKINSDRTSYAGFMDFDANDDVLGSMM